MKRAIGSTCKCGVIITQENTNKVYLNRKTGVCKKCVKQTRRNKDQQQKTKALVSTKLQNQKTHLISNSSTINLEYFKEQEIKLPKEILFTVQAAMGTGKTRIAMDIINSNPGKMIVYVSPQKTSIDSTIEQFDLNNIKYARYQYSNQTEMDFLNYKSQGRVFITTPDSYHRIQGFVDILIIDEAFTVFSDMLEKTKIGANNPPAIYNGFRKLRKHKCVVLLDAFIPQELISLFDIKDVISVTNIFRKRKAIKFYSSCNQTALKDRFLFHLLEQITTLYSKGEKVLVQSDSISFLNEVKKHLPTYITGIVYTSENRPKGDFSTKSDVILVSPVVKVGVSIPGIKNVFLYSSGRSVDPYGVFQMIDRARESTKIEIAIQNGTDFRETFMETTARAHNDTRMIKFIQHLKNKRVSNISYVKDLIEMNYDVITSYTQIDSSVINNFISAMKHAQRDQTALAPIFDNTPAPTDLLMQAWEAHEMGII